MTLSDFPTHILDRVRGLFGRVVLNDPAPEGSEPARLPHDLGEDLQRRALAALAAQGRDIRLAEERIEGYRNFANKIWNASRLALANIGDYDPKLAKRGRPSVADRWILSRLAGTVAAVRKALDGYRFNDAASAVYQFLWHELCDWYLEIAKRTLYQSEDPIARAVTQRTLVQALETTLRLLHPFMPFLSEEIWQRLPHTGDSIMIAPFPKAERRWRDPDAERAIRPVIDIVGAIRAIRSESRISPAVELSVTIKPASETAAGAVEAAAALIGALSKSTISIARDAARPPQSAHAVAGEAEVFVHLAGVVDLTAERNRLLKEIDRAEKEIRFLHGKLERSEFVERAPAEVVERERGRLGEQRRIHEKLSASLAAIE